MGKTLEVIRDGGVATIWMDRAEVHNAFNPQLIGDLTDACREVDADAAARVVVLAGRGKSFSAGADLHWMEAMGRASLEENQADARRLAAMFRTLAEMGKPTIARVQGAAIAGGVGLISACDMAIAASTAVFAISEVRLGLIPAVISPYVIRAIGERHALRYFQTAERISAKRACEIGLVGEVVLPEQLDARVEELTNTLLEGGPQAQAAAKDLIRNVAHRPLDDALIEDTARRIATLRATSEGREGLAAFLGKRAPVWARRD